LAFSWQAIVGADARWLTFAITAENFTSALGTVTFVAYLSALCNNPLHTATQYALLTALTAFGRTIFALGSGYLADATGWTGYFILCHGLGDPELHPAGLAAAGVGISRRWGRRRFNFVRPRPSQRVARTRASPDQTTGRSL